MVVPYGTPERSHYRKNVFDSGELGFGRMANSLTLGCDCLGAIHYFDAEVPTVFGTLGRRFVPDLLLTGDTDTTAPGVTGVPPPRMYPATSPTSCTLPVPSPVTVPE